MLLLMANEPELVRCVECRHEYEAPSVGNETGCPACGSESWVSARIPAEPLESPETPAN
jgi:DNA-directed RNA polymerase subunit RPC12/RpoP